jgi:hypothetical protein
LLAATLVIPPASFAQEKATAPPQPAAPAGKLKIVVLQGEGAVNNIASGTATQVVVEVRDEADKPVPGAEVLFQLPAAGPGGAFHGWMRTQTAKANEQGQAGTSGMAPNDEPGRFNIKVTATEGARTGSVVVAQTNARRTGTGGRATAGSSWKWKIIGLVATGAVVGGIYAAKRNGGTVAATSTTTPVTVTVGSVTVAGPR